MHISGKPMANQAEARVGVSGVSDSGRESRGRWKEQGRSRIQGLFSQLGIGSSPLSQLLLFDTRQELNYGFTQCD